MTTYQNSFFYGRLPPILTYEHGKEDRAAYLVIQQVMLSIKEGEDWIVARWPRDKKVDTKFLVAVHCDITVWYMTLVMSLNRSIYPFTPERPRDLSARTPEPALRSPYLTTRLQICLGKKLSKTINPR